MPDRIIRESALLSPTLEKISAEAERLFWRLTLVADDYGRLDADPRAVVARAMPLWSTRIALKDAACWVGELIGAGLLVVYHVGERIYATFKTWAKYQRHRDSRPKFPAPEDGEVLDAAQYVAVCGNPRLLASIRRSRARVRGPRAESREARVEGRTPDALAATPPPRRAPSRKAIAKSDSRNGSAQPEPIAAELQEFMAKVRAAATQPGENLPARGEDGAT